jgi:hypothetical protein
MSESLTPDTKRVAYKAIPMPVVKAEVRRGVQRGPAGGLRLQGDREDKGLLSNRGKGNQR